MPRLSDTMEEGTILKWLIGDGAPVARGEELVEIETDKATIAHLAEADGTLEILAAEGTTLPVGAPIARILAGVAPAAGPDVSAPRARAGEGPATLPPGTPQVPLVAEARDATAALASLSEPDHVNGSNGSSPTVLATPLARRMAAIHGVALAHLAGSGPGGRITRGDVLSAAGVRAPGPRPFPARGSVSAPPAPPPPGARAEAKGANRLVKATRLQQLVARRMAEAKATIPHFQVQTEVTMDATLALRGALKTSIEEQSLPSLNDFVIKACAIGLRGHPRANGSYVDGEFELHGRINVGFAVATEQALIVPVVLDADTKSLGTIARETRRLAGRVRAGEIEPPELVGGTFTVSNLGMYGMTAITPVINPPQAAILGVGALRETLARVDGEVVDRTLMTLTLSCDHRILYGADAAALLGEIRRLLETPVGLAL